MHSVANENGRPAIQLGYHRWEGGFKRPYDTYRSGLLHGDFDFLPWDPDSGRWDKHNRKKVEKALSDLTFSKRRISADVKKCLQSAIANAENNHNLDVDELIVAEAYVGKNLVMKRGRPRARGRFGALRKPFSELTIKVRQVEEQA